MTSIEAHRQSEHAGVRKRRLRMVHIVPDLAVGGAERHVTTLMPALDSDRFDPSVICIGQEGALFSRLTAQGVPALALRRTKRSALLALFDLVRELRRLEPDVVLVRGYNAEVLGRIAAVLTRVPAMVVWVHNIGEAEPRGRVRRQFDQLLDRVTSAYFGVARAQVDYISGELGLPKNKIRIIHNGVDPAAFNPLTDRSAVAALGIADEEPVVALVAAMRPEKDYETFLEAAQLVHKMMPATRFLLVGDGPVRPKAEARAASLGLSDRVVFTGSRDDVPELLRGVDVFVLCSYTVECFPMALLEAMAAGRPAVCTSVGGVPEMIDDGVTGYLVPPRNPRVLAEKLLTVLGDPDRARAMGAAARRRVEGEFSLQRSVAEAESAIEEVAVAAGVSTASQERAIELAVIVDTLNVGGVEVLLRSLFSHFDPALVHPRVLCLRDAGPLADEFRSGGLPVEVLSRSGPKGAVRLLHIVSALRRHHVDAVLVAHHQRAALLLGPLAAKFARVPATIVAAHDMALRSVGKRVFPRWAVESLWLADVLVLLSPSQGRYLRAQEGVGRRRWSRAREVVIPNGITVGPPPGDADRIRARTALALDDDEFVVGSVARLTYQKAHHVLLEAIAVLVRRHPRCRLVLLGDGERREELERLARDLGISDHVVFAGVRRDVPELLPAFDVSALSSVHEAMPMGVIESMAAGLAIVATDTGALRDVVSDGESGYIVPVGDYAGLAERLAVLAEDPELRARMGASGRARVMRDFTIEQTARSYETLLMDLVARRNGRRRA